MATRTSVMAVTLHGGGHYYLDPLLAKGRLPNLARLIAHGRSGPLVAPYPITAACWVTLFTGQSVGVHGVLDHIQLDARSYHGTDVREAGSASYRDQTLFSILSRAGRHIASLYLPMTNPPWPVNGVMISGFPLDDERWPPTWPPELGARIGPMTPRPLGSIRYEHKAEVCAYLDDHQRRIRDLTLKFCDDLGYDLVMTCFALPDLAHHYFWNMDDPAGLEQIYRVYEQVDEALGAVIAASRARSHFVLFSDHGGGPAPQRRFNVNRWLLQEGYLALRSRALDRLGLIHLNNRVVATAKRFKLNRALRRGLRGSLRAGVTALTHNDAFFDWRRSRAYAVDLQYPLAAVEINLRGRQRAGIVEPGADYDSVRDTIRGRLERLEDGETGRRVCRSVHFREELFHGSHLDRLPDLVAILDDNYDARIELDKAVFQPNVLKWDYPFMGYHAREGILVARGPGIEAGSRRPAVEMMDVAPSLVALLGVDPPDTMEGRVVEL